MITIINLAKVPQTLPLISEVLFTEIQETLKRKEKVMLYLNRRGSASALVCEKCQKTFSCPRCDVLYRVHDNPRKLMCHMCERIESVPTTCPKCSSNELRTHGVRVQQVEESLIKSFPDSKIIRIDSDTEKPSDTEIENADIILGTQMLSSFHVGNIGIVGFLLFETELVIPSYDIEEKVYTHVSHLMRDTENVIIQTYVPDHPLLKHISEGNYRSFFTDTLKQRKEFGYPPYGELVYIWVEQKGQDAVKEVIHKLVSKLERSVTDSTELFYDKELFTRFAGQWRQKIILKGKNLQDILETLSVEIFRNRGVWVEWK